MPKINVVWVLTVVAVVMGVLAFKDWIEAKRITPAVKSRLLLVAIFVAVLIWLSYQPHDFR